MIGSMGKGLFIYRRRKMAGLAEKGLAAGASLAGSRAFKYARQGRYRQALAWSIPR